MSKDQSFVSDKTRPHRADRFGNPLVNLGYGGGGGYAHDFLFIFLLNSPDQTLRPTCEFLILGIFYNEKKKIGKFSV